MNNRRGESRARPRAGLAVGFLAIAAVAVAAEAARAEVYELPPAGGDVIGALIYVESRAADTLLDIARRHGLGYEEIVRANPGIDPWLPGAGTRVVLPTRYILPPGPRRGLVLNLPEYRMYYFPEPEPGEPALVMTYPVSIGRMDWATPLGETRVVSKVVNPAWYPPESVRAEHAADGRPLPRVVPPGPDNPLGTRAMRLGLPSYLIHGTNRPAGVGMRVTHGCIRMFPEDIEFLFERVRVNTPVRILNEPVKLGWDGDRLLMEVHRTLDVAPVPVEDEQAAIAIDALAEPALVEPPMPSRLTALTRRFVDATSGRSGELDWDSAERLLERADGIPVAVGNAIKNAATSAASE
ncbi:MAG TPA: L,D-transpeptidase family protein [Woeseiaceae bacterium]|nr:L,D-transpeptidase family protein [Woeseiaceae bacterium]